MNKCFHTQLRSFFFCVFAVLAMGAVVSMLRHVRRNGSNGACREVFEGRHCSRSRQLRFSMLIVLPEDEEILDFTTGDKEFWVINGAHNLCYVHPAQAASAAI